MPNVADDDMETLIFSDESEGAYDPSYYSPDPDNATEYLEPVHYSDVEQPYPAWMEEDRY